MSDEIEQFEAFAASLRRLVASLEALREVWGERLFDRSPEAGLLNGIKLALTIYDRER